MREFDDLLQTSRFGWPSLHCCLTDGGASEAELVGAEQRVGCVMPNDVLNFYRLTKLKEAKSVEPLLDVYTFYPFDWLNAVGSNVISLWRLGDTLFLPLMSDGCGVEICWEISCGAKTKPRLVLREYGNTRPYFDSIEAFLLSLSQGIRLGILPMKEGDDDVQIRRIFSEYNPASCATWADDR